MTDEPRPESSAKNSSKSGLETHVDDVFGIDFKFPRTLRDLVLRPGRVADAALAGDDSVYSRPLKVLMAVYAVQILVSGWFGVNDTGTFGVLFADNPAALARVETRLTEAGSSLAAADDVVSSWTSWTTWPLVAIASLFYILVIWVTSRPRLGLRESALLYVVASAGSTAATLPLFFGGGFFGVIGVTLSAVLGFLALFVYAGIVMYGRAAEAAFGLSMRLLAFVLTTIPVLVVGGGLALVVVEIAFRAETGLSRLALIAASTAPGG